MSALDTVERTAAEQTADPDPLVHMWCLCRLAEIGATSACGMKKITQDYVNRDVGTCVVCVDLARTGWVCPDCGTVHAGEVPS